MAGDVKVEHFDDGVSLFVIDRETKRNAISAGTALELQQRFQEFDASAQRVAVVTGAGTASFSAGADVNDVPEAGETHAHTPHSTADHDQHELKPKHAEGEPQ